MDFFSVLQLHPDDWALAILVFLRIVCIFVFLPIFGDKVINQKQKISIGIAFAIVLYPSLSLKLLSSSLHLTPIGLLIASLGEVFFAFCIGYASKFLFYSVSTAAHLVGVNMGFQVASMFNPETDEHDSSWVLLHNWIVLFLLLSLNVHHLFIVTIYKSFFTVPIGAFADHIILTKFVFHVAQEVFLLAIKLASPLILVQVLISLSLGLVNRILPALNIFSMNFPISFVLSVIIVYLSCAPLMTALKQYGLEKEIGFMDNVEYIFKPAKKNKDHGTGRE